MEIDDSDTEEVDEMNIINNDSDVDSNIDVEDKLRLIFSSCLVQFVNWKYFVCDLDP